MSELRPLNEELAEIAVSACNEHKESREASIVALQAWIKKSPHLKARNEDQLILAFLRTCRFSLEETKRRVDGYYALKNLLPEVLCERGVNEPLLEIFRRGVHIIPQRPISSTGPCVIISQYAKLDPKNSHPRDAFKLLFMLIEILALENDNASVSGLVYVVDARDATMEQMMQYDPFLLKKTFALVESFMPLKFIEIHMINMRREGQAIFNFVTSLLPQKLPFKFMVHKKAEDLYEHVPRDVMTTEYGGHNGYNAEALQRWENKLLAYKDYFAIDVNYGTNEKLRVGLNKDWAATTSELSGVSGVSGSFRRLEVD